MTKTDPGSESRPPIIPPLLTAGMFLAASLSPLGSTMIAVALPSIGSELGIGGGPLTQWLVSSYLIVGIAAMSPGGRLGDRIGHRRALVLGMAVFGAGSVLGFTVAALPALALARMAMAAGGSMTVPATLALLRNLIPLERRPRAFGYFGSAMGIAAAIGPLVGGELTVQFGWRAVFIANLPVIALSYGLIRWSDRAARRTSTASKRRGRAPRFDILGSLLLGGGLSALVLALRMTGPGALTAAGVGVALLTVFPVWERRVEQPVLDLGLFRQRTFVAASLVVGLQNLAMYSLLFQLPIFFEAVRDVEPGTTGRSLIAMMIAMVIGSPLGGRLAERIGTRATAFAGTLISLVGVYLVSDFTGLQTPEDVVIGLILVGGGLGISSAPSQAAAMSVATRDDAGMAGGAISTTRYVGGVIGISTLGYVLGSGQAGLARHETATVVYLAALAIAAISALALPGRRRGGGRVSP